MTWDEARRAQRCGPVRRRAWPIGTWLERDDSCWWVSGEGAGRLIVLRDREATDWEAPRSETRPQAPAEPAGLSCPDALRLAREGASIRRRAWEDPWRHILRRGDRLEWHAGDYTVAPCDSLPVADVEAHDWERMAPRPGGRPRPEDGDPCDPWALTERELEDLARMLDSISEALRAGVERGRSE